MEPLHNQNDPATYCSHHPNSRITHYCPVPECQLKILCNKCVDGHEHQQIKDINSLLSDESFISLNQKVDNSGSNSTHNKAVMVFIQSVFQKLQGDILKIIETTQNELINKLQNEVGGDVLPVDAVKIELGNLREELMNAESNTRYQKMKQYTEKYVHFDLKLDNIEKKRTPVPIIDEEEYAKFLKKFYSDMKELTPVLLKPPEFEDLPAQIDTLEKRTNLLKSLPGVTSTPDSIDVGWVGMRLTKQNIQDLHSFIELTPTVSLARFRFGKYYLWGPKGSNIDDSDMIDHIIVSILQLKELKKLKLNLTRTRVTNKILEPLKQLSTLSNLKKLFISVYETSITKEELNDFAKYITTHLSNTKITIRNMTGETLEYP